jgi:O-antigen ligase
VGPWSTWTVLVTPLLFGLIAPPPAGFGNRMRSLAVGFALIALVIVTDRMTDNRIVWIALAGTLLVASIAAALRWPQTFVRTPLRWAGPLAVILLVLGVAFVDAARERAAETDTPGVAQSLERDPRIALWENIGRKLEARPWLGYGFGRRVLAGELAAELHNPLLAHAHNTFVSQWLQTGLVGMAAFCALLLALVARYVRFARARDDALAFAGVVGIALVTAFVLKNLTDDFLFRSNAKELWALSAMVLGFGMRREREIAGAASLTAPTRSPSASAAARAAAPAAPPRAPPTAAAPPVPRRVARTPESTP